MAALNYAKEYEQALMQEFPYALEHCTQHRITEGFGG